MADRDLAGVEKDPEDADELLYTDLNDNTGVLRLDSPTLRLDHCDLLLDAIDAQLVQLQVQPQKNQSMPRRLDCHNSAPLRRSQSLSKDTGFGSTTQTNDTPMSCLDFIHSPTTEQTSERCFEDPVSREETKQKFDRRIREKDDVESQREQIIWRLERLLGDTCDEGRMAGETHPPSDSICTEDFDRRFRDEMVEFTLPESNMQQPSKADNAERAEITESDTCQHETKEHSVPYVDAEGTATTQKSSKGTVTTHYSQSEKPCRTEGLEKYMSEMFKVHISGSERARERHKTPQGIHDDGDSIGHRTEVETEHETQGQSNNRSPQARSLAGVPVWSFDAVSIDSDLDSVRTEQVRQHLQRCSGWRYLIQSVKDVDDYYTNQSDYDTTTQDESEPRSTSGQRLSFGNAQNRGHSVRKAQRSKRESYRRVGDNDTDEEINHWRYRPDRTREKMRTDWIKMKDLLSQLQQKCEKEEETLQLKKARIKDVELSLSELQQRRKHALQDLERLTAETAKMEKERTTLEFVLRDSKTGKDSVSCQQAELQKQRGSCILEPGVAMSVLEREEMDRQLDSAKTQLFAEQRRAREKLESMQEKLEETHEELQRVTEAESLLRSRCACLEEKQRRGKDQIEAVEFQVGKLQSELGECIIRRGTLESMLAQKELQLLELQEQREALQAERDGLKGELQHLKTEHYSALKEAQRQTQTIMLKEEEAKKLRDSLEQQKHEAKSREDELHAEAQENVTKAIEEEKRKWEAEKMEAVRVHCGRLEEQSRHRLESMRSEMQQEKSKALALQHNVAELKASVQELESDCCAQQREQESVLAAICKSLKDEHQAELRKLQRQMTQDSQRVVLQLEQATQRAEKEADRLRVVLEERERSHNQITAGMEQRLQSWAQELGAECQSLHLLLEQGGAKQSSVQTPPSPTIPEALKDLKILREQLNNTISHLHQELDSQKHAAEHLRNDKERALSVQRQQLRLERDQALKSLKERLIQEHIEELSSLKWAHLCDGGAEGGGVAASLRKQLKAKDMELRQVQRSMGQWKEQTAARLACKFEDELTAELERKMLKTQEDMWTKSERPKGEMSLGAKESQNSVCFAPPPASASYSPSDVASFKLLHYLQGRVKQLRVENETYTWSLLPPNPVPLDFSGSYLTTINQGQDTAEIQSHSSVRTLSS